MKWVAHKSISCFLGFLLNFECQYCIYFSAHNRIASAWIYMYISGVFLETNESFPFCGNASLPWHKLLKFHKCTTKYRHQLEIEICAKRCKFQCRHFKQVHLFFYLSSKDTVFNQIEFLCNMKKSEILASTIFLNDTKILAPKSFLQYDLIYRSLVLSIQLSTTRLLRQLLKRESLN